MLARRKRPTPGCRRASATVAREPGRGPPAPPRRRVGVERATSGVNRKSGRTKTRNHRAANGPVTRSPSRAARVEARRAGSKPEIASGPCPASAARKPSDDHEGHEPAEIADRPAGAGQPPEPLGRHEARHHGVVEHRRDLDRDGRRPRSPTSATATPCRRAGRREPERRRGDHEDEPRRRRSRASSARSRRAIGAEDRREGGQHEPAPRGRIAPEALARRRGPARAPPRNRARTRRW